MPGRFMRTEGISLGTHGCVSQGLGDVCFLKLRKFGENLGGCHLVRDHRDHSRHWDAQAPDAWHASHHVGVDGDAGDSHVYKASR